MRRLFSAHLFKLSNGRGLLLAHLFESDNALICSRELLTDHAHVRLHALGHTTFPHALNVELSQVSEFHELVLEFAMLDGRERRAILNKVDGARTIGSAALPWGIICVDFGLGDGALDWRR